MDRRQMGCLIGMVVILLAWVSAALAGTVPEEAQRYMARGMAAVEMAKTPKDYKRAVREFEQAAKVAPNWPDVYFNLGSVQAKAGNYGEAMRHYKRYLELAPKAPDAAKVREEVYKLEYRAEEEQQRKEEEARVKARARNRFVAYSNGTVLDTQTNLMWAATDNGENINWADAKNYCENYRGGGYKDWRMPTQNELAGLYDSNISYKATQWNVSVHLTELIQLSSINILASGPRDSKSRSALYDFGHGGPCWVPDESYCVGYRALPVRSAQSILDSEKASVPSLLTGAYKGVRNYENGDKYEGEFTNRNLNGKGTYTYANGDKYEGVFVNGKFTSKGTFTCSNGKQFTGNLEGKEPFGLTITCD
jgi:tetratricopeptide (TPR) repeat protein